MKRKVTVILLSAIFLLLLTALGIYLYKCTHYWQQDYQKTLDAGFQEKQRAAPDGSVINYAEGPDNGDALLLIHGQTGAWQDYCSVLPELSKNWHVFVVDCYGHGKSEHDETKYYLKENGDDLIWFTDNIIQKNTVVSGHSSGGLLAAYVAAYENKWIEGAVLEDPPVFSTEKEYFEGSFAYQDTYQVIHDYLNSEQTEGWEAYYLRHCLWGRLYMPSAMDGLANYAQNYQDKHPDKPVQFFFLPESINFMFLHTKEYDLEFGEHFFNYTWHSGIDHETLMKDIQVPTVFIHILAQYTDEGVLLAAASDEQAEKAAVLIKTCELITLSGEHDMHRFQPEKFIAAVNRFAPNS